LLAIKELSQDSRRKIAGGPGAGRIAREEIRKLRKKNRNGSHR